MTPSDLKAFISSKMSITHIYQPAILLALLENQGTASLELIAKRCSEIGGDSEASYQQRLVKYPKEALTKHGVLQHTGRTEFKLALDLSSQPEDVKQDLLSACKDRLAKARR